MHKRKLDSRIHAKSIFFRQPGEGRRGKAEHPLLRLQRLYGNRYVQQVLAPARKANGEAEVAPEVEEAIYRKRGGGQALGSSVLTQMESSFGADFRGVRVHTDADSDALNRSLNSRAFTTGQDIFFKEGTYSPGSSSGRELLAHELTHVVQQTAGLQRKLTVGQPGDRYEQEADQVARAVIRQEEQPIQKEAEEKLVQRQVEEEEEEEPIQAKVEDPWVQRQVKEAEEEEEPVQAKVEGSRLQRQAEGEKKKTPEWKEREKRFELFIKDLKPKDPKSNMERFNVALDKLLLTLGHEETAKKLSSKLGLDPKGRLLWQFVTNTGASLWLLKQGKLPNVIPDIRLSDNLLLDVDLGGTFQKPDLMLTLKWKF